MTAEMCSSIEFLHPAALHPPVSGNSIFFNLKNAAQENGVCFKDGRYLICLVCLDLTDKVKYLLNVVGLEL